MNEMNESNITKLEIEEEGCRISMEKATEKLIEKPTEEPTENPQTSETNISPSEEVKGQQVLSPMVGTFYAQPAPDKDAFVKVGDKVKKGQILCIIEAMKLMNEIESEYDGEIVDVFVEDEEMVEYGQPLFLII